MKQGISIFVCCLYVQISSATLDSSQRIRQRKTVVWCSDIGLATGVHTALYQTWYSTYPTAKFHWINDNKEWLQMDKVGHAWSAAIITNTVAESFKWAGYNRKKSAIYGASSALVFQFAIEYFDGRSAAWGASSGDLIANTAGLFFSGIQQYFWGKSKVPFRFSVSSTRFHKIRPDLLGHTFPETVLKDYNGQTYWLDFNPNKLGIKSKWWPKFLGISMGYGATGMVGGNDNIWLDANKNTIDQSDIKRYRQFYLSPSLSFGYVKTRHTWLKPILWLTEHVRIPLPTLEFGNNKAIFHWIHR